MYKSWIIISYLFLLTSHSFLDIRSEAYADEKLPKKQGLFFDSNIRARYEFVDWVGNNSINRRYSFPHLKLQAGVGYEVDNYKMYSQLQHFQLWDLNNGDAGPGFVYRTANNGETNPQGFSLRQAYLKGSSVLLDNFDITGGRFLYSSGNEVVHSDSTIQFLKKKRIADRIIGAFDFTGGRSFDGVRGDLKNDEIGTFTLMASHPTQGGFETNVSNDIDKIDLLSTVFTTSTFENQGELQLYYYYYNDDRGVLPLDSRALDVRKTDLEEIQINTFGSHLVRSWNMEDGVFESLIWGAYQSGDWGSQRQNAFSIDIETGYKFEKLSYKPWIRAGYTYGSGDNNSEDNKHTTFFQMLPTVRIYAQTPFYNMMNMHDFYVQLMATPRESLSIKSELHFLQLAESNDLLYSGGGAGERLNRFGYAGISSGGDANVGTLLDIDLTYQIDKNISATLYYGHLFGGEMFGEDDQIDYGFLEFNYKI